MNNGLFKLGIFWLAGKAIFQGELLFPPNAVAQCLIAVAYSRDRCCQRQKKYGELTGDSSHRKFGGLFAVGVCLK